VNRGSPLVSVCIPTHDRAKYLGLALRSCLDQALEAVEVIVADDGSTDGTAELVRAFGDARVRYVRRSSRIGVAGARNACLELVRGRYIAWLDSDDAYLGGALAAQACALDRHPGVGLIHGGFEVIDEDGRRLPDWPPPFDHDVVEPGREAFNELILANYICTSTVMVRRECQTRAGLFAPQIGPSSTDWEMWLRIALHADLAYLAMPIAMYRFHQASVSAVTTGNGERLQCDVRAVRLALATAHDIVPEPMALRRRARAALAWKALAASGEAFTSGRRWAAFRAAARSMGLAGDLIGPRRALPLLVSALSGREFAYHRHSTVASRGLSSVLLGSRFGDRMATSTVSDPGWESTQRRIARNVRRLVPKGDRVAVADKHDPTILHLSRRNGWHFPDRRFIGGYPPNSGEAIRHLENLRNRGVAYLVVPSAAFWWLEHYEGFRLHLEARYQRVCGCADCVIFDCTAHPVPDTPAREFTPAAERQHV
jgi:glycosyltransferase involved in cell wall biosynthesis